MKAKILKSRLAGVSEKDFDFLVQTHARNLREWHTPGHDPYPPPWSQPVVEEAIRKPDFVADYEIVDDTLPTLRQWKDEAISKVFTAEQVALADIYSQPPFGKLRLAMLEGEGPSKEQQEKMARVNRAAAEIMARIEDWTDPPKEGWDRDLARRLRRS